MSSSPQQLKYLSLPEVHLLSQAFKMHQKIHRKTDARENPPLNLEINHQHLFKRPRSKYHVRLKQWQLNLLLLQLPLACPRRKAVPESQNSAPQGMRTTCIFQLWSIFVDHRGNDLSNCLQHCAHNSLINRLISPHFSNSRTDAPDLTPEQLTQGQNSRQEGGMDTAEGNSQTPSQLDGLQEAWPHTDTLLFGLPEQQPGGSSQHCI